MKHRSLSALNLAAAAAAADVSLSTLSGSSSPQAHRLMAFDRQYCNTRSHLNDVYCGAAHSLTILHLATDKLANGSQVCFGLSLNSHNYVHAPYAISY